MANPTSYRRPAFINRPWITGLLYDTLQSSTVIHCDAYVFTFGGNTYLQLEWREGGSTLVALDTWLIEPDGLSPVWDLHRSQGALVYVREPRLHARVIAQAREAGSSDRWSRVSLLCHYIDVRERDPEKGLTLVTRKPYGPRKIDEGKLPDIL